MTWIQHELLLRPRNRGFHLVTEEIVSAIPELIQMQSGLLHLMILHTSASLTLNENADPDVRHDFKAHFEQIVPERAPYYRHTLEGDDDMPAHIKGTLTGFDLTIPVRNGRLWLGTWQGIYLCEHRDRGGTRRVAATLIGKRRS
ncbi:MAG: secondary thiamine-phosphate synthase enzyme YjbQ [Rhodothermales bacterium]